MIDFKKGFIHYGGYWCPDLFKPIENQRWNKPYGGLWSSPVESDDWKRWCEEVYFSLSSLNIGFTFNINQSSRIYIINSKLDLEILHCKGYTKVDFESELFLDFEKLSKVYDGLLLTYEGQIATRFHRFKWYNFNLLGWDVETLLVFNKDIITNVRNFSKLKCGN